MIRLSCVLMRDNFFSNRKHKENKFIMKNQIKNNVSATDIQTVQATLVIPLAITIICSTFDMLFHIKLGMIKLNGVMKWSYWIFGTLISYFFPSFLASASSLFWQYYFTNSWAGIKTGKGLLLGGITLLYFLLYVVYLLFADTSFTFVFVLLSLLYVWFVLKKCLDEKIFKKVSITPNDKVMNTPI